jgi:hypothetical protein
MTRTLDLGSRVELVPMDPHCGDISVALYEQPGEAGPEYRVHSYSGKAGTAARLEGLRIAMERLAGLERAGDRLRFPCGAAHGLAIRRAFLEACKVPSGSVGGARPLTVADKKLGLAVSAAHLGEGVYELASEGATEVWTARVEAIAGGLRKLGGLEEIEGAPRRARFGCGRAHDALVGLLLPRALNVRASLREQELAAARGVLVAPSAQQ